MKTLSLGTISASATSGVLMTGGTNATPIVATITAGHGLKTGDRVHISGVTGLTAMNGEWELEFASATTAKLVGSVGNGTFGGTAVVNVVCKKTPFMPRHSALAVVQGNISAGTIDIEGHDGTESSAGVLDSSLWVKASKTGAAAILPAATAGSTVEVFMYPYMRVAAKSALTGSGQVVLAA